MRRNKLDTDSSSSTLALRIPRPLLARPLFVPWIFKTENVDLLATLYDPTRLATALESCDDLEAARVRASRKSRRGACSSRKSCRVDGESGEHSPHRAGRKVFKMRAAERLDVVQPRSSRRRMSAAAGRGSGHPIIEISLEGRVYARYIHNTHLTEANLRSSR